ncbi:MAG: hypothetical protein ACOH5I_10780 [Oligoflexus sp.]
MRLSIFFFMIVIGQLSCQGDSAFQSSSKDKELQAKNPQSDVAAPEVANPVQELEVASEELLAQPEAVELANDEQNALNECVSAWPDHPFSADELKAPTTYIVQKNIGNSEVIFTDNQPSAKPHLKLVVLDIRIGNQGAIELLDRQAWTCVYFKGKVANGFQINQICDSRLAIVSFDAQNANNFVINEVCPNP